MKTTIALTLDTELIGYLNEEAARRGTSLDATVEDLLALMLLELETERGLGAKASGNVNRSAPAIEKTGGRGESLERGRE